MVALALLLFGAVSFAFNWIGDVTAYTKWYTDREIWSQFNTRMPLDRTFYSGGVHLIKRLYEVENDLDSTERLADLPEDVRERYEEFKGNIELFTLRLSEH